MIVKDASGHWRLQAGIVSWGDGCARKNFFGVYSRLAVLSGWVKTGIAGCSACGRMRWARNGGSGSITRLVGGSGRSVAVMTVVLAGAGRCVKDHQAIKARRA